MSKKNDGGAAFPQPTGGGATMRDYFAAKALPGVVAAIMQQECHRWVSADFAREAYDMADAMLAERSRGAEPVPVPAGDVESSVRQFVALALEKVVNAARHVAEKGQLNDFSRVHFRGQIAGLALVALDSDAVDAANAELDALIARADRVAK